MIYDKFIPSPTLHLLEEKKFYIEFKLRNNNEIERNMYNIGKRHLELDSVMDVELRI